MWINKLWNRITRIDAMYIVGYIFYHIYLFVPRGGRDIFINMACIGYEYGFKNSTIICFIKFCGTLCKGAECGNQEVCVVSDASHDLSLNLMILKLTKWHWAVPATLDFTKIEAVTNAPPYCHKHSILYPDYSGAWHHPKRCKKIHYGLTDIWDLPQFCFWLLNPATECAIL